MVTPVTVALNATCAYWSGVSWERLTTFAPAGPEGPVGPVGPAGPAGPAPPSLPPQPYSSNAAAAPAVTIRASLFNLLISICTLISLVKATLLQNHTTTGAFVKPDKCSYLPLSMGIFELRAGFRYKKQLKIALGKLRECGSVRTRWQPGRRDAGFSGTDAQPGIESRQTKACTAGAPRHS